MDRLPPISPYLLERVETALGIKLSAWQKAYLLDKYYAGDSGRSGKAVATVLKLMLSKPTTPLDDINDYISKVSSTEPRTMELIAEAYEKLTAAGIQTSVDENLLKQWREHESERTESD